MAHEWTGRPGCMRTCRCCTARKDGRHRLCRAAHPPAAAHAMASSGVQILSNMFHSVQGKKASQRDCQPQVTPGYFIRAGHSAASRSRQPYRHPSSAFAVNNTALGHNQGSRPLHKRGSYCSLYIQAVCSRLTDCKAVSHRDELNTPSCQERGGSPSEASVCGPLP